MISRGCIFDENALPFYKPHFKKIILNSLLIIILTNLLKMLRLVSAHSVPDLGLSPTNKINSMYSLPIFNTALHID